MKLSKENIKNHNAFQYIIQRNKTFQETLLCKEFESYTFILLDWENDFRKIHNLKTSGYILGKSYKYEGDFYINISKINSYEKRKSIHKNIHGRKRFYNTLLGIS